MATYFLSIHNLRHLAQAAENDETTTTTLDLTMEEDFTQWSPTQSGKPTGFGPNVKFTEAKSSGFLNDHDARSDTKHQQTTLSRDHDSR